MYVSTLVEKINRLPKRVRAETGYIGKSAVILRKRYSEKRREIFETGIRWRSHARKRRNIGQPRCSEVLPVSSPYVLPFVTPRHF
jgi:hypothetical protein